MAPWWCSLQITRRTDLTTVVERKLWTSATLCVAYTIESDVFDWDENNLRKIRAHRIKAAEVEEGLSNNPILIYKQDVLQEPRYVYYCETNEGRLLAAIVTERGEAIRVVTAYDLDAGQKKDYLTRRAQGE
jgi:uncharacterized DUF497 family protein